MSVLLDFMPTIDAESSAPFAVLCMATPSYAPRMQILAASARRFGLPVLALETPSIHRSISPKGIVDSPFTKPNLIEAFLKKNKVPVLYIDSDCVIEQYPEKIFDLCEGSFEFGIYNWLADRFNEAYAPASIKDENTGEVIRDNRYYALSHSVNFYDPSQLIASGSVQFWRPGQFSFELISAWRDVINQCPRSPDDQCLEMAYNYEVQDGASKKRAFWFDKAYCRKPFWIDTRPVINHPDFPYAGKDWENIEKLMQRKRFRRDQAEPRRHPFKYPRECIIDIQEGILVFYPTQIKGPFAMQASSKFWHQAGGET